MINTHNNKMKQIIKVGFNILVWTIFIAPNNFDEMVDKQVKVLKQ